MLQAQQVTGLVLCGGESRRMGRDKALLPLGPSTQARGAATMGSPGDAGLRQGLSRQGMGQADLLDRTVALLRQRCREVLLASGDRPRYTGRGLDQVLDRVPSAGPLGGLEAGLERATTEWVLAVPCDLPLLDAEALDGLLERAAADGAGDLHVWSRSGQLEPLCCLLRSDCAPAIRLALDSGQRRVTSFWGGQRGGRPLRVQEHAADESVSACLVNVNTSAEWNAVRALEGPRR